MTQKPWTLSVTAMLSCALIACGGGGGGGGTGDLQGGIEGSGHRVTSAGAVTALGSIFVNGVEYSLTGASITLDGLPAAESDLAPGQVVIVEGTTDDTGLKGTARRVTAGIAVAGPISAVNAAERRVTILGQTIEIDGGTAIVGRVEGNALGGLAVGSDVEVTGFADSSGVVFARRIAARRAATPLLVTGYAMNVDTSARTFSINGQRIGYATATLVGFDTRALSGSPVRVQLAGAADVPLRASQVSFRDLRLPGTAGDAAALQGWVTRFASASDFDVDGHPVVTTATTKTAGPIQGRSVVRLDAFVSVRGSLLANGVVEASEVRTNNLIALESTVYGVGAVAGLAGKYLFADLWEWAGDKCRLAPETLVSVDGVPANVDALRGGEVASIYEHFVDDTTDPTRPTQDSVCQIVAVEHAIRGPLETKPTESASFYVMGQRVWLDNSAEAVAKGIDVYQAVKPLAVGAIVEVSGHLTAAGDLLATGIHSAVGAGSYRVTGLAHHVDTVARQFQLGSLAVFYSDPALLGFANGVPAEGDRVSVLADSAPLAGTLRAMVVRYSGGLPRGADGTGVKLSGLVTRYTSATDFAVEGRSTIASPTQTDPSSVASMRCDLDKVHGDMRFVSLLAYGIAVGEKPQYFFALCPPGRRIDSRGPSVFPDAALSITGPVVAVDAARLVVRVGGVDVALDPDTLLTDIRQSGPNGNPVTTPVRVGELKPGDRIKFQIETAPGELPVAQYGMLGDPAVSQSEVEILGLMRSATQPDVVLKPGLRVHVSPTTLLQSSDCGDITAFPDAAAFWVAAADWTGGVHVTGSVKAGSFAAERIELASCVF